MQLLTGIVGCYLLPIAVLIKLQSILKWLVKIDHFEIFNDVFTTPARTPLIFPQTFFL